MKSIYIIAEENWTRIQLYLNYLDIYPKYVGYDIINIKDEVIFEDNGAIIYIIDSGMGNITDYINREILLDLLGISSNENIDITVMYSSTDFKRECQSKIGRNSRLTWIKYAGTRGIANSILQIIKDNKEDREETYKGDRIKQPYSRNEILLHKNSIRPFKPNTLLYSLKDVLDNIRNIQEQENTLYLENF